MVNGVHEVFKWFFKLFLNGLAIFKWFSLVFNGFLMVFKWFFKWSALWTAHRGVAN